MSEFEKKTALGLVTGFTLQLLALAIHLGGAPKDLSILLLVLGWIIFIQGCFGFAQSKGHASWLGLSGLASIFGLLVLVGLPRHEQPDH